MSPILLKAEQVAVLTGLSRTRIFELMRTGALASLKVGRARPGAEGAAVTTAADRSNDMIDTYVLALRRRAAGAKVSAWASEWCASHVKQ